jgi:hydrogenase expression/formation protein HypD
MLRVPGTDKSLLKAKAEGADVRMVYSPLDALAIAQKEKHKQVVFFAVGFETTAPANALSIIQARKLNITNFSVISSHVLVPPAMEAILQDEETHVQGFLAAGHVCTIMGADEYYPIAEKYRVPIVITGFEPLDLLQGIYRCICQLEDGRAEVENEYSRAVPQDGNPRAKELIREIFEVGPRNWRGIGAIAESGLRLKQKYAAFDAEERFEFDTSDSHESPDCIAGEILQGHKRPHECPAFGSRCTPEHPLGAPMVSAEGACSAYFKHRPA